MSKFLKVTILAMATAFIAVGSVQSVEARTKKKTHSAAQHKAGKKAKKAKEAAPPASAPAAGDAMPPEGGGESM